MDLGSQSPHQEEFAGADSDVYVPPAAFSVQSSVAGHHSLEKIAGT